MYRMDNGLEWSVLHTLNGFLYRHDGVEDPLLVYINASEALFVATLLLVFLFANGARLRAWRRAALAAVLSAGVALVIAKVISELVDRARPFVVDPHGIHLFSGHAADPGFPSDHATGAFAVAMAIYLRNRRWGAVALIAAAVLSIGRVAVGEHFPATFWPGQCSAAAWRSSSSPSPSGPGSTDWPTWSGAGSKPALTRVRILRA
jgi:undecaprenyl-diphosphatase